MRWTDEEPCAEQEALAIAVDENGPAAACAVNLHHVGYLGAPSSADTFLQFMVGYYWDAGTLQSTSLEEAACGYAVDADAGTAGVAFILSP